MEILDQTSFLPKTTRKYPYIYIENVDEFFPCAIGWAEDGDLPIVAEYAGKEVELRSIALDLKVLQFFISNYKVKLHMSEESSTELEDMGTLLDKEDFWK